MATSLGKLAKSLSDSGRMSLSTKIMCFDLVTADVHSPHTRPATPHTRAARDDARREILTWYESGLRSSAATCSPPLCAKADAPTYGAARLGVRFSVSSTNLESEETCVRQKRGRNIRAARACTSIPPSPPPNRSLTHPVQVVEARHALAAAVQGEGGDHRAEVGVPGPFADPVDGALDEPRPGPDGREAVGDGEAGVVVAVDAEGGGRLVLGPRCLERKKNSESFPHLN